MIKGDVECAVCNNIVFDCVGISTLYRSRNQLNKIY